LTVTDIGLIVKVLDRVAKTRREIAANAADAGADIRLSGEWLRVDFERRLRCACELFGIDAYEIAERCAIKEDSGFSRMAAARSAIGEELERLGKYPAELEKILDLPGWLDIVAACYERQKGTP